MLLCAVGTEAAPRKGKGKGKAKPSRPAPAAVTPGPAPAPAPGPESTATSGKKADKEKTFDFAAMGIEGRVLAPQLLYLLGRIKIELEKGDLEKRSFVPELVRSVDEGGL